MAVKSYLAAVVAAAMCACAVRAEEPVDLVNPEIGTISHLLVPTFVTVQRPNSMFRFNAPYATCTRDRVRQLWITNPGHRGQPVFAVRPYSGAADGVFAPWFSTWDQPHSAPYRYDVWLDTCDVKVEVAPGKRTGVFRFSFGRGGESHALVFAPRDAKGGSLSFSDGALEGKDVFGWIGRAAADVFLRAEFDSAPSRVEKSPDGRIALFFDADRVSMRCAVSYISSAQAAENLRAEDCGFDLDRVAADAREIWNGRLSSVAVEGGTPAERRVFYTALWRCFERMVDITEAGGRYHGWDGKTHDADGTDYYVDDWTWDTFRAAHPLMTILAPGAESAKLASYVRMAEQNPERWMPTFPGVGGDFHNMVNRHAAIMFLDAWRKGIRGYDAGKAFALMDHTEETESLIPWYRGPLTELDRFYKERGYYPSLRPDEEETVEGVDTNWERRQSVSVTQGASYDAWALAEFGREIGADPAAVAKYAVRAKDYANLWNPATRFFHPKDREGRFIEPFDYVRCGGFGARNHYTENNAWIYVWDVQHDIPGLLALFGGGAAMSEKLDAMLNTDVGNRRAYIFDMPDGCTGLMGVYTMANEPCFHIPYMYDFTGEPWKTQKFVRKTLDCWFRDDKMGMCGDEDGGGMSAYAVFSMMGFYPVTPGVPEYRWGSPVFRRVSIRQENGKTFTIEAPAASADAKYIQALSIDGVPADDTTVLPHEAIARGATVRVEMGERPNRNWGVERIAPPEGRRFQDGDREVGQWR